MGEKVKYRISDIAAIAGVSSGTVDRILHNRGGVSPESRKKVEDVLQQINYVCKIHSITPKNERQDRKSTRLNSSHNRESRMPSSA